MSIDTDWFKALIAARGLSQRELAKKMGVDHSALSLTFRGKRTMKMTEAADLARLLGVPVAEVMENAGVQADTGTVPFRGWIDGHAEMHTEESRDRVPSPRAMPVGSFAVQYRTTGSPLEFADGWMAFVQAPTKEVPPECIGKFSLVKIRAGVQCVGTLRRGYKKGLYNLSNAAFSMTDADVEWAAPILYIET